MVKANGVRGLEKMKDKSRLRSNMHMYVEEVLVLRQGDPRRSWQSFQTRVTENVIIMDKKDTFLQTIKVRILL